MNFKIFLQEILLMELILLLQIIPSQTFETHISVQSLHFEVDGNKISTGA